MSLSNKNVLVTGATGGIGLGLTKLLLEEQCNVVASGSRPKIAIQHENLEYIQCDLSKEGSTNHLIKGALERISKIDILICNFGIKADGLTMRMSLDNWEKVINLNLTRTFEINKAVVIHMIEKRIAGRIINVSSIVGSIGNPGQANYAASKAGLEAMSRCIASEVAKRGITINCIAPGFIDSGMTESISSEIKAEYMKRIPIARFGTAEDIFHVTKFLADENAGYITGQTIHVNGGMLMT